MPSIWAGARVRHWRTGALAVGAAATVSIGLIGPAFAEASVPASTWTGEAVTPRSTDPADYTAGTYIVQVAGKPLATYDGGVSGYAATAPAEGDKLDASSSTAKAYRQHLERTQNAVLAEVGADAMANHTVVFNGITATLSADQAAELAGRKDVVALTKDSLSTVTTDQSPEFLNMPRLWNQVKGGRDNAGKGIVVGVIDSGIWPESRSFAAQRGISAPADWNGTCVAGQEFSSDACNGKLIGARYYLDGFGADNISPEEFVSPRDGDGHGSHTASTAAGNRVDDVSVDAQQFGTVTGMAPAANVAAYKVCWIAAPGGDDGCSNADSVAAINDAVEDGVDVINYSIGSQTESAVTDPVEIAFLNAAAAGVFVAASAGNSGPDASTLDHPSPWLTTVAASTHRISEKKLVLGDGQEFVGASTTDPLPDQTPMVLARSAPADGVSEEDAALCQIDTLDPAAVEGKLVVCERGVTARIEKSLVVRDAGGAAMVLVNPSENSLNGDLHFVPAIHVGDDAYEPLLAYGASDGATGAILELEAGDSDTRAPVVAAFSSRGPSTTTGGDILKPDIAAPGVDVLAAVTPFNNEGRAYSMLSGTSMASPHIAGIAAVLKQVHPDWSPMAIKSAMMTSATDTFDTATPFEQGAGQVTPASAYKPPVVFDHGVEQWLGYLVGEEALEPLPGITAISGTDINQASIAAGAVTGTLTTSRTMTNVTNANVRFTVSADVPGFTVEAAGDTRIRKGSSGTLDFTFTRTTAPLEEWAQGYVTLTAQGNKGSVRLPVALRPTALALSTDDVAATGTSGETTITVTPGTDGTVTSAAHGLLGTAPIDSSLELGGEFDYTAPEDTGDAVEVYDLTTTEAGSLVRFSTDGADSADLDLWVYLVEGDEQTLVGFSATATADEVVTFIDVPAGVSLRAYVHGYGGTDGAYTQRNWAVGPADLGTMTLDPQSAPVTAGTPQEFTAAWSGLDEAQDYLGWASFTDADGNSAATVIEVR